MDRSTLPLGLFIFVSFWVGVVLILFLAVSVLGESAMAGLLCSDQYT